MQRQLPPLGGRQSVGAPQSHSEGANNIFSFYYVQIVYGVVGISGEAGIIQCSEDRSRGDILHSIKIAVTEKVTFVYLLNPEFSRPDLRRPADVGGRVARLRRRYRRGRGAGQRTLAGAGVVGEADRHLQPLARVGVRQGIGGAHPDAVGLQCDAVVGEPLPRIGGGIGDARSAVGIGDAGEVDAQRRRHAEHVGRGDGGRAGGGAFADVALDAELKGVSKFSEGAGRGCTPLAAFIRDAPTHRVVGVLVIGFGVLPLHGARTTLGHHPVFGGRRERDGCGRRVLVVPGRSGGQCRRAGEVGHLGSGCGPAVQRHRGSVGAGRGYISEFDAGQRVDGGAGRE